MENISKNISYKEATHSNTAKARKIDNTPFKINNYIYLFIIFRFVLID
jgi:hypothetical protein